MKKIAFILIQFLFFSLFSQEAGLFSYAFSNPDAYKAGLELSQHLQTKISKSDYENADIGFAIVFPELMRYSEFRDDIEAMTNKILSKFSPEAEGCSIGYLQIKPIFACSIEIAIANSIELKKKYPAIDYAGTQKTGKDRKARIERLIDFNTEFEYLMAFIDICIKKFELNDVDDETKIKLLAAAYNAGFFYSREQLIGISKNNSYPYGLNNKKSKWNYSQIAFDFYQSSKGM